MDKIKSLFSTPKKAVITTLVAVLIVGILGTCIAVAAVYLDYRGDIIENRIEQKISEKLYPDSSAEQVPENQMNAQNDAVVPPSQNNTVAPPSQNEVAAAQKISARQAEDIALKDAGIARSDADRIFSHFEMDDGFYQYEVQIHEGEYEYEYTVSAEDGRIFEKDVDYIFD